jgi:hypothetical protein
MTYPSHMLQVVMTPSLVRQTMAVSPVGAHQGPGSASGHSFGTPRGNDSLGV